LNSRNEVLIASLLAIILSSGLGVASYCLFAEMPFPETPIKVLDLHTQKGGFSANEAGGVFEPFDIVFLYAYLTIGGAEIQNTLVRFTFRTPSNAEFAREASTNESGIATTNLTISLDQSNIGMWQVFASANVTGKVISDQLSFNCQSLNAQISVYTKRKGLASAVFLRKDDVCVEAQVAYKDTPVAGVQVNFEVRFPNNTIFLMQSSSTTTSGVAAITFQISWPSENALGIWHVTAETVVYQQPINATVDFECQLLPIVLDVYTQKGGYGQNKPSRSFTLFEMVYLYAEIRDSLNETVPDKLVGFEVRNPTSGKAYLVGSTNVSGIAAASFRIPYPEDFIGTWEVYARAEYNDTVILDTLIFKCEVLGMLDVYTQKGGSGLGQESGPFVLNETVYLYVKTQDSLNQAIPDQPVMLEVKSPDGNTFLAQTVQTNASGIATLVFTIPENSSSLGTWRVYVHAFYNTADLFDALIFRCEQQG